MKLKTKYITQAAFIAALYVVLTYISALLGISSGIIQCRFSEALCVLPAFFPSAVPGLFAGCLIANFLTGAALPDIIFGSLATLIGAFFTKKLSKKPYLASIPPVLANTLIIPFILAFVYNFEGGIYFFFATVFAGEVLSCTILGLPLIIFFKKNKNFIEKL